MSTDELTTHDALQILGTTCDNASNNDTMIDEMAVRLENFEGSFHRVRCFAHVINLVAKSLLRQFDVQKARKSDATGVVDEDVAALLALAEGMDEDEAVVVEERRQEEGEEGPFEDDAEWVDEIAGMTAEEREEFEVELRPVKLVIAKVSSHVAPGSWG